MRFWQNWSLFTRLVVPSTILIFIAVSIVTFVSIQQENALLSANLQSEAIASLNLLEAAATTPLLESNVSQLDEIIMQETGNWEIGRVYSANGRLLVDSTATTPSFNIEPDPIGVELLTLSDIRIDDEPDKLIVSKVARVGNQTIGALTLEFSKTSIINELGRIRTQGIVVATTIIVLSMIVLAFLSRTFSRATNTLIHATEEIAQGNLSYRTALPGTLELNTLAHSLNQMTSQLEQATTALNRRTEELRDALVTVDQARARAEKANRAKSDFLAKVSHELKTPLGGILGNVELLYSEAYGEVPDEQQAILLRVMNSSNYLIDLINELLDQAKLESGEFEIRPLPFLVEDFVNVVDSRMVILAQMQGLSLGWEVDPQLPKLLVADERRLQQVAINLINNAIKFTQEGTISVALKKFTDDRLLLQVTDKGLGISEEDQLLIFEPFRQVGSSVTSHKKGIGLGLSIVKQLVGLMGGSIELESELGVGSTFSVYLPIKTEVERIHNDTTSGTYY